MRATTTMTMKRARRNKRRGRETATGCNITFTSNDTKVGVSEVKAVGYDKLLAYRVNNDDDNNEAMDNADPESKAPVRTGWDLMW